jgi:hypothetical protein
LAVVDLDPAMGALEEDRFENGTLLDVDGESFEIVTNTATTVTVRRHADQTVPCSGAIWLEDDDHLANGPDVPMPDYTELASAMAEAYVDAIVEDDQDDVDFLRNVSLTDVGLMIDVFWGSRQDNSEAYWVTYILGAFQYAVSTDNDPNTEGQVPGTDEVRGLARRPGGGSMVFLETIRDTSAEHNWSASQKEQDSVVHELGHATGGSDLEPVTKWSQGDPSRYTEDHLKAIRTADKPLGPA